jgi:hypothetical protein
MHSGQFAHTHRNETNQLTTETHVVRTLETSTGEIVQHSVSTTTVETFTVRTPRRVETDNALLELLNGLIDAR